MNDEQNKDFEEMQKSLKELEDIISKTNFSDIKDINNTVAKASGVYEKFPDSEKVAKLYVRVLNTLARSQDSLADKKATVAEASGVYEKFPDSKDVVLQYLKTLNTLAITQGSLADKKATVAKASGVYEKFPDSKDVAFQYLRTLNALARSQDSLADVKATVAKVFGIYKKFPDSKDVVFQYLSTLNTLARSQDSLADVKATVAKVSRIYERFSDSEIVAYVYVLTLGTLASRLKILADIKVTLAKAFGIYERFPDSEKVAYVYVKILVDLARNQDSLADVKATVAKAYDIYEKFPDSEKVAYAYAKALVYLESRQDIEQDLMKTFDKVIEIYEKFSNKLGGLFADLISEDIIGNIFYSNNNLDSFNSDMVPVIKEIFNTIIELDGLKLPGYAPLIGLLKDLEDCYREQLIKIYWIVQKIKYELSIKVLSKNQFGHYTSGDVLQILLKQSSDKREYSIEGRTRLGNVKYMNDPEEGSILDRYLELGKSNNLEVSLKPSPWFLMSLTTKIDDLAMWSQYGARAEGVCLVLKTDSFKVYKSMAETEWIRKFDIPILEKKLTSTKGEETNSSDKKDYLYRVCYLDEELFNDDSSKAVTENNNKLLSKEEIRIINNCLRELKGILNGIDKNSSLYSAFEECLEEIRYLFKVSGYHYESELRILKYAKLDPDNTAIKIDDKSGPVAKLYLERDMPIQLEQVIFGPKFSNPEHVVPLLHLLDKEIELKRSERKFK